MNTYSSKFIPLYKVLSVVFIGAYAIWSFVYGTDATTAKGSASPGAFLCAATGAVMLLILAWGRFLWKDKEIYTKELGAVLFILAPEPLFWLAFQNPLGDTNFFYISIPCWVFFIVTILFMQKNQKNNWRLLTIFLIKACAFISVGKGLLRAPWVPDIVHFVLSILVYPLFFLSCYQLILFGFVWRWRERQLKSHLES